MPRTVEIDLVSGTISFKGLVRFPRKNTQSIDISKFSRIYAAFAPNRIGLSYYVALSNGRGDDAVIVGGVDKTTAGEVCAVLAARFGLNNQGLV